MGASGLIRRDYRFGDVVLNAFVATRWHVAYVPEVVAVYRESPHSALRSGPASRVALYKSALDFDTDAREYFRGASVYTQGFRWESDASLFYWALRARDLGALRLALKDYRRHFNLYQFVKQGVKAVGLRMPALRANRK